MKRLFFFFAVQLLMATAVQSQDYSNSDFVKGADVGFLQGQERRGVFYWEPQCLPGGYKLGAFNSQAAPTVIMDGFIEK